MAVPANLPNQVGVQGIQAQMALWFARAANAVNYLLGRTGGSTFYAAAAYPGYNYTVAAAGMLGAGYRWGTAHGSKTGTSCILWNGTMDPPTSGYIGVAMQVGTGASPAQASASAGTTIVNLQYSGTTATYSPYSMATIITWPAADSWFDMYISPSASGGLMREYTVSVFDVAL